MNRADFLRIDIGDLLSDLLGDRDDEYLKVMEKVSELHDLADPKAELVRWHDKGQVEKIAQLRAEVEKERELRAAALERLEEYHATGFEECIEEAEALLSVDEALSAGEGGES